jgi:flagellar hook-associated protein 3 FlgL
VRGDVELTESTLDTAHSAIVRLGEIAMQGGDGALNATDRAALASEVRQLKGELLRLSNTKGSIGFLFGGTADQSAPFDSAGVFQGNALERSAQIGPSQSMVVSVNGALAFTAAGGQDLFVEVDALATALDTNNQAAISSSVNSMDTSGRQILAARVDAGVKMGRIDTADAAHSAAELSLSSQRSGVADADPAEAYTRLNALQSSLQQSITVARSLLESLSVQRF